MTQAPFPQSLVTVCEIRPVI